jgi:hypothetical protein
MKLNLPVKNFASFVGATHSWFNKTNSYKQGLEICLQQSGEDLSVSVYAELNFIEAILVCPEPVHLPFPLFLDLGQLANYSFKTDYLHLVLPTEEKLNNKGDIEYRAQFKAQNTNFKIPFRDGEYWKKNKLELSTDFSRHQRITFPKKFLTDNMAYLYLPDSFKVQEDLRYQLLEKYPDKDFIYAHDYDNMAAYCLEFNLSNFPEVDFTRIRYLADFLLPIKKGPDFLNFTLANSKDNGLCYGSLETSLDSGIKKFCWAQPTNIKAFEPIPSLLAEHRKSCQWSLVFNTKEFAETLAQATQFFTDEELRSKAIEISAVGTRYNIAGVVNDSEMNVEGDLVEAAPHPVKIRIQPRCLKDYLKNLDANYPVNIEVYSSTIVMYQKFSEKSLVYWLPVHDR